MAEGKPILIIEPNDFVAGYLRKNFERFGLEDHVCIRGQESRTAEDSTGYDHVLTFAAPIRLGRVLDRVYHLLQRVTHAQKECVSIQLGDGFVDLQQGLFWAHGHQDESPVRLTEKEIAVLQLLYAAKGKSVTREDLLDQVWNYSETVETHTLETHIYRLRQKIEADPAHPVFLKTDDMGYSLSL